MDAACSSFFRVLCCFQPAPTPTPEEHEMGPLPAHPLRISAPKAMQSNADLDAMKLMERDDPALHAKLAASAGLTPPAASLAAPSFASSSTAAVNAGAALEASPESGPRPTSSVYSQEGISR